MRVAVIVGTRPEAIKMAPIVKVLREDSSHEVLLCATGQHREMLAQALTDFGLEPDINLNVMKGNQSLSGLTAKLIGGLDDLFSSLAPDWVLVQGDTTTVMAASLCAYYNNIRVGHVEAGLRSFQKRSPFPEEINRKITGVLADLHFAPTTYAKNNLLREGVPEKDIIVTGNTVIDALLWTRQQIYNDNSLLPDAVSRARVEGRRIILITCHRRESFGPALDQICDALMILARNHPDCQLVYPVHLNPNVQHAVRSKLALRPNIALIDPVPYKSFVALLNACYMVLSDSGGVQEEAPSFDKPVLVLREVTERPEGVSAGVAKLVGTDTTRIVIEAEQLLTSPEVYENMAKPPNPYGDGKAAARIRKALYA